MRATWVSAALSAALAHQALAEPPGAGGAVPRLGNPPARTASVAPTRTATTPGAVGAAAPLFYLRALNPASVRVPLVDLNRWVGPKATAPRSVLLSFAADYCGPCKRELRAYAEHEAELAAAGAEVVVVLIDDDPAARSRLAAQLRDEYHLPFPVVADALQLVAKGYGVSSLPHNVIVGRDGKVAWVHRGYREGESLPALLEALRGAGH